MADFATWANIAATGVTAMATIALWRVTRILAIETKVLAKSSGSPAVVLVFDSSAPAATFLNVMFINTGSGTAFDVMAEISPAIPNLAGEGGQDGAKLRTSLLAPKKELVIMATDGQRIHESEFKVSVSWATEPGGKLRETTTYRMTAIDGFKGGIHSKGIHEIASELGKLRQILAKR